MRARATVDARPRPWRRRALLTLWLLGSVGILARAGQIQVVQSVEWSERARQQHQESSLIPAARGSVLDREGRPLSVTRERVRVYVAPTEVADLDEVQEALVASLGVTKARARALATRGRGWNGAGLHAPSVREQLDGLRGVHLEFEFERYSPHLDLARGALGVVLEGEGRGGIEQIFDEHLRGLPGRQIVARDHEGNAIPGEQYTVEAPRSGGEVVLTLDTELQEIAQAALLEAVATHDAHGGDVVITDPYTGEILALFSTQDGYHGALSAVTTSFEPGSTLKPFTVAALLENDLATMSDTVDVGDGRWVTETGRVITDIQTKGVLTLREALQESSNIGIAKLGARMSPGQQYEALRDFGLGVSTGSGLPGEASGVLRRPSEWSALSAASLAYGYEIAVTPLQMVMAYGALANGGVLMEPRLVREIREADGSVLERFEPRVVRQVISEETARDVGKALESVVTEGTGSLARVGAHRVAGKSGTARFSSGGGYVAGEYSSSFVGYFPAGAPQLVVFVKLDRPRGDDYYGGAIAAPVTRATMEAALAAVPSSLSLSGILAVQDAPPVRPAPLSPAFASRPGPVLPPVGQDLGDSPSERADGRVPVPDLSGYSAREAIRHLHRFGLRVAQVGLGEVNGSTPPAGSWLMPGDTVRLRYRGHTYE